MECIVDIDFKACEDTKYINIATQASDEGHLLTVPVYLYNVCPCRKIVVGVQIFVNGRLYALKTCKVFTGYSPCCRKICKFYVDEFDFLFTDEYKEDIKVEVMAHYIY